MATGEDGQAGDIAVAEAGLGEHQPLGLNVPFCQGVNAHSRHFPGRLSDGQKFHADPKLCLPEALSQHRILTEAVHRLNVALVNLMVKTAQFHYLIMYLKSLEKQERI